METKALIKREEFKVKKIKDLFIKHGNHSSKKLDSFWACLGGHSHSKDLCDILKENCLGTSLRYLRVAVQEVDLFGKDLNMPRIKESLLKIAILSLIVNEHLERQCYLTEEDC